MLLNYFKKSIPVISSVLTSQEEKINNIATIMAMTIERDKIIYAFGTGHSHMIPMEMFGRAGGLANVCAMLDESILNGGGARRSSRMENISGIADVIWEQYMPTQGDILFIVSNSGINQAVIEMALKAKNAGIYTIAITSIKQSMANESRHASGLKLYQIANVFLDNGVVDGDASMTIGDYKVAGLSSLTGIILVNTLLCQCIEACNSKEIKVNVFMSQNMDRKNNNEDFFSKYRHRIPHF